MMKLGEVFIDDRGDLIYVPDRQRPPFVAGTPVELRNMLINAVLKVVKDKEGTGNRIIVYPQITCLYPKQHHHDKGQPYTDSEILLARGRTKEKEIVHEPGQRQSAVKRSKRGGASPRKGIRRGVRRRPTVSARNRSPRNAR